MSSDHDNNPNFQIGKGKQLYMEYLKDKVLENVGLTLDEFVDSYPEDKRFQIALKVVTSTKKSICEMFDIPVEAGCRYKRDLEKRGLLMQSIETVICPYTKHQAHLLSCDPSMFSYLSSTNQFGLFNE